MILEWGGTPVEVTKDPSTGAKITQQLRTPFSKEEDEKLVELVRLYSLDWDKISKMFGPTRSYFDLKERYYKTVERSHNKYWGVPEVINVANMSLDEIQLHFFEEAKKFGRKSTFWSRFEDDVLLEIVRRYGINWPLMESIFAGRWEIKHIKARVSFLEREGLLHKEPRARAEQVELDIPEEIPKADPKWTPAELCDMRKIVDQSREGEEFTIDPSELPRRFPGRTDEEIKAMRRWVSEDSYDDWLGFARRWAWHEVQVLVQFVNKYGTDFEALYRSRCLPGRTVLSMQREYQRTMMVQQRIETENNIQE